MLQTQAAADDYGRLKALFLEVCDLPDEAAVRAHLAGLDTEPQLAERVLAMVREDAANSTRFSRPVAMVAGMATAASASDADLAPGATLGAWRLLSVLGEGGMGKVYLAERSDGHYEQRAAIKLLSGWTGPGAREQLARERQILASLQHPHIARLLDGGTTPGGRPYLVMDFVEGQPLDAYVRRRRPGLHELLELFAMVCDAVAYAHRQLVVHCDLKPGNVLVGADGRAQLLDFGIAQLQDKGDDTAPRALTPRYASPEQRAGEPGRPASDIFSLGRVLEELLQECPAAAPRAAEWRAIVARACAAAPAARYASVDALQSDLRRLREHRPVLAMQGGWLYRTGKGLRRQWPWALAAAAALTVGVLFTWRLVEERDRSLQAEAKARQETAAAQQVSRLLVGLFEGADPARSGRPDVSATALVDIGHERIAQDLKDQPELQARMFGVLGEVYGHMGQPRKAITLHEQTAELQRRLGNPLAEAEALRSLAAALADSSQFAKALAPARRALELRRQANAEPLLLAAAMATLGNALGGTGAYAEAEPLLAEALALRRSLQGESHADVAHVLYLQGVLARFQGQHQRSEARLREALQMRQQLLGPRHHHTLLTHQLLGAALASLARFDDAVVLLRELVALRREVNGPASGYTALALNDLANALQDAGRTAQAAQAYRDAAEVEERVAGRPSARLAVTLNNLGSALEDLGDPAAEAAYRDALAQRQAVLPAGDLAIARGQHNLGRYLSRVGRHAEARPLVQTALARRQALLPAAHEEILGSLIACAEVELALGRADTARGLLETAAPNEQVFNPLRRTAVWRVQAQLLQAQGDGAGARAKQQTALEILSARLRADHPSLLRARLELAQMAHAAGLKVLVLEQLRLLEPQLASQHERSPLREWAGRLSKGKA